MVFKFSKGGVNSGNTLRGLNTTTTKRYGRHACLLGHTSLKQRDLSRLFRDDDSYDKQLVSETLAKTDVLLSLNKHQRWRLPAMIRQMITDGDFHKGALVSMLEKHKLKRTANCVSLVSNKRRTSRIAPKNNRYFSFSSESVAYKQSKRKWRRDRAKEFKASKIQKIVSKGGKVIQTFTTDGKASRALTPRTTGPDLASDKPEYRLQVFYPCPRSCSLTYNPKYTDVIVAEGKTGEMEVKSNVKTEKKGLTTHRRRITSRDVERLYCDEIDEDVKSMWDNCEDIDDVEDDESSVDQRSIDISSTEYNLDTLVSQAKKTKELYGWKNNNLLKNVSKKRSKGVSISEDKKSHIVYVDRDTFETSSIDKDSVFNKTSIDTVVAESSGHVGLNNLEYIRVILPTSETSPEELKRNYGTLYFEASCQPRRFIIDITDDIANLLATSKASTRDKDFSSYLVCIYDGFYDDGLAVFKLTFNSMVGEGMKGLSEIIPFTTTSISNIVNALACHLLDLKERNSLKFVKIDTQKKVKSGTGFLNSRLKLRVEVLNPSEMSKMAIMAASDNQTVDTVQLSVEMEDELFCDVCYVSVTPSRIDSVSGTKLNSCGHLLCNECWASHFRTCISAGKTVMACGGYDCNTKIEPVMLMSVLNVSEVALPRKRQIEEEIESMENAKWCPQPGCGRLIKVDSKSQDLCVDVNCACGNKICFTCMGPAHWPARCDQAEEYMEKLPHLTPSKEYVEEESKSNYNLQTKKTAKPKMVKIEGRLCPNCNKFIQKSGGCEFILCRCGFQICWSCMRRYHHLIACKPDHNWVSKQTRILVVKHAVSKDLKDSDCNSEPPKIQKNKQRASLYQRALQQRAEVTGVVSYKKSSQISGLIFKMVTASEKDLQFKREIMSIFVNDTQRMDDVSVSRFDAPRHLKTFIQTIIEMKKELHKVREFTFVLLQGTPHSVAKQCIIKLVNDLNGFCSFVTSILDLHENQDAKAAFRRLVDLQKWAERALDALIKTSKSLRMD